MDQGEDSIGKRIDFSRIDIGDDYVLLAPLAFLMFLMFLTLSIGVSIDWYFLKYALSDLADPSGTLSAGFFDAACISSGIVLSIYASCRLTRKKSKLDHVAALFFVYSSIFLIGVGLFPVTEKFMHDLMAIMLAFSMVFAIGIGTVAEYRRGRKMLFYASIGIMIAAVVAWKVMYGSPLELAVIILAFIWSIFQMLSERS